MELTGQPRLNFRLSVQPCRPGAEDIVERVMACRHRGSTYRPGVMTHTKALGYNVITMRDYVRRGEQDVLAELHQSMKAVPSICPGTWIGSIHRLHFASRPRRK
jgi:hypothetical protein